MIFLPLRISKNQTDPWQVVSRQMFIPRDYLLISVAFVVLCRVGCLWITGVLNPCKIASEATLLAQHYMDGSNRHGAVSTLNYSRTLMARTG